MLTLDQQYKIFIYYLGDGFQLGTAYLSPLPVHVRGKKDRLTSFNVYQDGDKLKWKDFGGGGFGGDALDFIIVMEHRVNDTSEALSYFNKHIKNCNLLNSQLILKTTNIHEKHMTKIKNLNPIVTYTDEFLNIELDYFHNKLLIDKKRLISKRIYSLISINWGEKETIYRDNEPTFIFDLSEHGDMSSWKMYKPLTKNKKFKFKSWNLDAVKFEGYYLLPQKMDNLMITSSRKDGIVAEFCLNDRVPTCNPFAEGSYQSLVNCLDEINDRVKNTPLIIFDGDSAGKKATEKLIDLTRWRGIYIDYPLKTGKRLAYAKRNNLNLYTKDITEIVENYSYKKLKQIFNNYIKY